MALKMGQEEEEEEETKDPRLSRALPPPSFFASSVCLFCGGEAMLWLSEDNPF